MKQIPGVLVLLYALALFQMSFFVRVFPNGWIPNFIVVAVVFFAVFERRESAASFTAALFGGFLLDIFSEGIIGFWPLVLLLLSFVIKLVLEEYVRISIPKKF